MIFTHKTTCYPVLTAGTLLFKTDEDHERQLKAPEKAKKVSGSL